MRLVVITVSIMFLVLMDTGNGTDVTPVVMYHGMGDTAYGSISSIKRHLEKHVPGIYVTSIEVGSNPIEDWISGYFVNLNDQVSMACATIGNDSRLANGYHALGFSQGGQILRAIAQRCPKPPMKNLITLGGQHQGVFGVPACSPAQHEYCYLVDVILNQGAYVPAVQNHLVQAQYWHDPLNPDEYREHNIFLADINNEKTPRNKSYKENLSKLENFVMVQFTKDHMVVPPNSSWFQFFKDGQAKEIYQFKDSDLYKEDWIGLKTLDQKGKLKFLSVDGDHLRFQIDWFQKEIVEPYLSK